MDLLFAAGLIAVAGLAGGALALKLRLPRITGYLVVGMLLSPSVLPLLSSDTLGRMSLLIFISLSIIGFSIGKSIHLEALRAVGRAVAWTTLSQGVSAWALTTVVIAAFGAFLLPLPDASWNSVYLPAALVIGAIAWPTAPAVTIALVREYRAAGALTTATLVAVAVGDAIAIVAFALAADLARALMGGGATSVGEMAQPVLRVAASIGLGIGCGLALGLLSGLARRTRGAGLVLVLAVVLTCAGAADALGLSAILANMVAGFVAANRPKSSALVGSVEHVEPPVFLVFFVYSGTYFDLGAFQAAAALAVAITLTRSIGKYLGAYAGASASGAPEAIKRYLGLALLPKAGLTIGLAFLAEEALGPTLGPLVFNGLLASMVFTPPLAKYAIFKSGEHYQARGPIRH